MNLANQMSWDNFRATVFLPGQQRVHRVTDSPLIEIFGDGAMNRIGIWLETPAGAAVPVELLKLTCITARTLTRDGREFLEVGTATPSLHRQFYHFAVAVAERVIVERSATSDAVLLELQCFTELLNERPLLEIERQVGLLGELVFLEREVARIGLSALDSWVGPMGEPHDFRMEDLEFEVKTTLSPRRIHTIHGSDQLVPSRGRQLYLVSVLLGPAGAGQGFSLTDMAARLAAVFGVNSARLAQFETSLKACGFKHEDEGHYNRQFALRRPLGLAHVDRTFPAITRTSIQSVLADLAPRVGSLQYDVDIEGLEHEDGSPAFEGVLPR